MITEGSLDHVLVAAGDPEQRDDGFSKRHDPFEFDPDSRIVSWEGAILASGAELYAFL